MTALTPHDLATRIIDRINSIPVVDANYRSQTIKVVESEIEKIFIRAEATIAHTLRNVRIAND